MYEIRIPRFCIGKNGWEVVHYRIKYSSRPRHLTAHNGLNFSKSIGNPNSRIERVREYLRVNGPRTKREILRDVFGKTHGIKIRGYASTMFGLAVTHGLLTKTRSKNTTLWMAN